MGKWLLLAVGGALGTCLRYWIGSWFVSQPWARGSTIFGTFAINVSGSFIFGFAAVLILERLPMAQRHWFLLLGTGFCGGYTTFSSFEWESLSLVQEKNWPVALGYVSASVLAGFAAVWLAVILAQAIWPASPGN